MSKLAELKGQRDRHMRLCGLDAFCRTASSWLEFAVAAESRGLGSLQADYERAAELREQYDDAGRKALANGDGE